MLDYILPEVDKQWQGYWFQNSSKFETHLISNFILD